MSKIAIFFSPVGGSSNEVANKLGEVIGKDRVEVTPLKEINADKLNKYDKIFLVGSTVGGDHWASKTHEDDWMRFFSRIKDISFENKKVALVGLGDSVKYPSHFVDGMDVLAKEIEQQKGKVLGYVDAKDYHFTSSDAVNEKGFFCGLPIDEDNEKELTLGRLEKWIDGLKSEFGF